MEIGSIVNCRQRQWVSIPSEDPEISLLKPLSGNEQEIIGIYKKLNLEEPTPDKFPQPNPEYIKDHQRACLLMDATRHLLRSGAGPFRCFGRISFRPRPYQIVPLLMALRQETVRLLIADDVGIGKTMEAGLIARELLDRGEIERIAVLCPPHLCDQWQRELLTKFHIKATVIRSGTANKLERENPTTKSIFEFHRHIIVSLDYAKMEKRKASFILHCPDLVIIDEAHTCTIANAQNRREQQRYQIVSEIAKKPLTHLLLVTATPHSGIEESFLSLLGLLKPEFSQYPLENLTELQKQDLANHFIQRRRSDVKQWLGSQTPFPERVSEEKSYKLSPEYKTLFDAVYDFATGLIKNTTEDMTYNQRRGRYWSALALIRCVMSSPAAAIATLERNSANLDNLEESQQENDYEIDNQLMSAYVYDTTEVEQSVDTAPSIVIEQGKQSYKPGDKRKIKSFIEAARKIEEKKDQKLITCSMYVQELLENNYNPIIWCRYIATAQYLAKNLREKLENQNKKDDNTRVIAITGNLSEEEREIRLTELKNYSRRVLVATDCLSEGINLQTHFSAAIHYDLPWNPNRLEQREGRIDRYGQTAPIVKSCLLYGRDNPVDGAVLDVLIRKAVEIHKTLGITVPIPIESANIAETIFKSLFDRNNYGKQLSLLDLLSDEESGTDNLSKQWDRAIEKEKISRTRFAQRAINPGEVERELWELDIALGSQKEVERFIINAFSAMNCSLIKEKDTWLLPKKSSDFKNRLRLEEELDSIKRISFSIQTREGIEYVDRNHILVERTATHILETALGDMNHSLASRCSFTITDIIEKRTTLLLLRLRHLIKTRKRSKREMIEYHEFLGEECLLIGFCGSPENPEWLEDRKAIELIEGIKVTGIGIDPKQEIEDFLGEFNEIERELEKIANQRAHKLWESHQRVRKITKEIPVTVEPRIPMDLLGVYILHPS
ncbi:helicase [Cylindrospermopsis raciborskii CENA303]|uniref:Helicase n=1 Tax=Cylindrospermopsis raciborskii CENA303 TaxID=1170769 RepID=A0A1X4G3P7_9CYAN|nr:helicase-related protein [Cylindrospermopsis raciborskii]OSO89155.1 helicase [Cylindrospermopsis raciborskii CENA303]